MLILQVYRRSWTASTDVSGRFEDYRPATESESELARRSPGGQFWLQPGQGIYYAPMARSNADQCVRVVQHGDL